MSPPRGDRASASYWVLGEPGPLLHPELVEQDPVLLVVLKVAHPARDEVGLFGVVEEEPRRLVGELAVDPGPERVRGDGIRGLQGPGPGDVAIDLAITEVRAVED